MNQKIYVQVGVTAMRNPDGSFMPSIPMYVEVDHVEKNGLTQLENAALTNICGFFAEKRKEREIKRKRSLNNETKF